MVDREILETLMNNLREISDEFTEKKSKLDKNREAIQAPDGSIPQNYQKAFSKLEGEVDGLNKRLSAGEEVMLKVVSEYVRDNAMGNLCFEKGNEGTQFFVDVYVDLLDGNWFKLVDAIEDFDLVKIDELVAPMREQFLSTTFEQYREYAKTLSWNK